MQPRRGVTFGTYDHRHAVECRIKPRGPSAKPGRTARAARVFRQVLADAERGADRLLLARALLAAGEALGSSMPADAPDWHDRGIALSREIGAVALVRAHQAG